MGRGFGGVDGRYVINATDQRLDASSGNFLAMNEKSLGSGFFHDDAFFRTGIGAQTASYAFLLIDLPVFVGPADRDRLLRAFAGA